MRTLGRVLFALTVVPLLYSQKDWPVYSHDPSGQRYSPLTQISTKNVSKLKLAWQYGIDAAGIDLTPANRVLSGTEAVPINGQWHSVLSHGSPHHRSAGARNRKGDLEIRF